MPLIIMCGFPCSGKSIASNQLLEFYRDRQINVNVVSDSKYDKNEIFSETNKEKEMRSNLKSEVTRLLNNDSVVILDSGNYIKGFRYELFCLAKSMKTSHVVIHINVTAELSWARNIERTDTELYRKSVFDELVQRFEAPDDKNRWDRPLITLQNDDSLPLDNIHKALFEKREIKQNKSTQSIPLNCTNYLYQLDRKTQDTVTEILRKQREYEGDVEINVPDSHVPLCLGRPLTAGEIARCRRQFISYSKSHPIDNESSIIPLFVQYLNTTLTR